MNEEMGKRNIKKQEQNQIENHLPYFQRIVGK
jgi:hypothetical protein